MRVRALLGVSVTSSILLLTGCSQVNKLFGNGHSDRYQRSGSIQSLALPPDLTAPKYDATFTVNKGGRSAAHGHTIGSSGTSVLPESVDMVMKGQGAKRYLEVTMPANALWQKTQGFWSSTNVQLKRDEPQIGIMETDWIEKSGHLPQGMLQRALGSILKNATDSSSRDRYTLRFERAANKTNIYMTHRGAEKVMSDYGSKWEIGPSRTEASAEMLNRLQAYLQTHAKKPKAVIAAKPKPIVKPQPVRQAKLSVVRATASAPHLSTPTMPVRIESTVNKGVALSMAGTLGAGVVNLPKKQVRSISKQRSIQPRSKKPVEPVQIAQTEGVEDVKETVSVKAKPEVKRVVKSKTAAKLAFLSKTTDGQPALGVRNSFGKTWTATEPVLKKTGFIIDGKNAKNGLYAIQYKGRKGKKAIIKKGSKQILHIIKIGKVSAMRLLDINGKPLNANKAKKILRSLAQGFNR